MSKLKLSLCVIFITLISFSCEIEDDYYTSTSYREEPLNCGNQYSVSLNNAYYTVISYDELYIGYYIAVYDGNRYIGDGRVVDCAY